MNHPTPLPSAIDSFKTQARTYWQGLAPRERGLVAVGASLLGLWLFWSIAISPAWTTLSNAPAQIATLDEQLQTMQRLAAETQALRAVAPVSTAQALEALKSATTRLGDKAKLSTQGDRSTLTLSGVSGEQLKAWLSEARSGARIKPIESQLTRGPKGYIGTLVVSLGSNS